MPQGSQVLKLLGVFFDSGGQVGLWLDPTRGTNLCTPPNGLHIEAFSARTHQNREETTFRNVRLIVATLVAVILMSSTLALAKDEIIHDAVLCVLLPVAASDWEAVVDAWPSPGRELSGPRRV